MVDKSDGITILPELAVMEFSKSQLKLVKRLKEPSPAREVSLVTHRDHIKSKLIKTLREEILKIVPKQMQKLQDKKMVEINYLCLILFYFFQVNLHQAKPGHCATSCCRWN